MGVLKRFSYDNIVIHDPTAPDPVDYEGGGEGGGGCTCAKDTYVVRLSNDGVLKYRDGETDVALLPSDIPSTGLISITLVMPDDQYPMYMYYPLKSIELAVPALTADTLYFSSGSNGTKKFAYDSEAGGFVSVVPEH